MTNPRMLNRRFCGHARTLPALTVAALVQEDLLGLSRPKVAGQMSPPPASTTRSFPSIAVNNTQSMRWSGKRSDSPLGTASVMAVPVVVSAVSSQTSSPFVKRTCTLVADAGIPSISDGPTWIYGADDPNRRFPVRSAEPTPSCTAHESRRIGNDQRRLRERRLTADFPTAQAPQPLQIYAPARWRSWMILDQ